MLTLQELEPQALALTQHERANLAASLLSSLPLILNDEDDGVAEALRRETEMDSNPSAAISLEEFSRGISAMRGQ